MAKVETVRVKFRDSEKFGDDVMTINKEDYERTPNRYTLAGASSASTSAEEKASLGVKSYGLAELRVAEAAELIAVAELGELAALEAEERAGKSRKGVFAALDKRREELQGFEG